MSTPRPLSYIIFLSNNDLEPKQNTIYSTCIMFETKQIPYFIFGLGVVAISSFFGKRVKDYFSSLENKDDYHLVKKYVLNDASLYGDNRPKIWVHSKYEVNARKWKNFQSRNSTDLNQPYLYVTIQSIVNHCGDDFHICLIDDDTFEKLLPFWDVDLSITPEPMRSRLRNIAMLQLVHTYGGLLMPNSLLCIKSFVDLYQECILQNKPIIFEKQRKSVNGSLFAPDIQMVGAKKGDPILLEMIEMMNSYEKTAHYTMQPTILGEIEKWCSEQISLQHMHLISGSVIGIKTKIGKPILLEDLMSDGFLDVDDSVLSGIYIPSEELLSRTKFSWFAILPYHECLKAKPILSKYMAASIVDSVRSFYNSKKESCSMVSI